MLRSGFVLLFTVFILVMLACAEAEKPANVATNSVKIPAPNSPRPAATIDELASGKKLYADNCSICHRDDGTGGQLVLEGKKLSPDNLTSAKIKGFSDEKILGYIMNGVEDEGMPAFKDKLSQAEMRDVLKFIRVELQKMPASEKDPSTAAPKS